LKYYKGEGAVPAYGEQLTEILSLFFAYHGAALCDRVDGWDFATSVASTRAPATDALTRLVAAVPEIGPVFEQVLERGAASIGHREYAEGAFRINKDVQSRRVLLIDDVFTTGARVQSAASLLNRHGATVVAIVVIARRIDPDFNEASGTVWARQSSMPFDWTVYPPLEGET
jgi:hypothetical protein